MQEKNKQLGTIMLALLVVSTRSWGYSIEGASTQTVTSVFNIEPDNLYVGSNTADNALVIYGDGTVQNAAGYIGFETGASDNWAEVSETGAVWDCSGELIVGRHSISNVLLLYEGGRLNSAGGCIGQEAGASGNWAEVDDTGTAWNCSGLLIIGSNAPDNVLLLDTGGHLITAGGCVGQENGASGNWAEVTGTGTVWDCSGNLIVGSNSVDNVLLLYGGGNVNAVDGLIGYEAGASNNVVSVSDTNSTLTFSGNLIIGHYSAGNTLFVYEEGRLNTAGGCIGHHTGASSNWVEVGGTGPVWNCSGNLVVGSNSVGNVLLLYDGGILNTTGGCIGYEDGAHGNRIDVSGSGTVWNCSGGLYVGGNASGFGGGTDNLVAVSNHALLSVSTLTVYEDNQFELAANGRLEAVEVNSYLDVFGTFAPGGVSNNSTMNGDLVVAANGTIEMEIGGNGLGTDYDHLTINGITTLTGSLDVVLLDGFTPGPGAVFDLFDWNGGVDDVAAAINLPLLFGRQWNTNHLYTTGELSVELSAGDSDGDNISDAWEYLYFGSNVAASAHADADPCDNLTEYIAGTDPTNGASFFHITNSTMVTTGFMVAWEPSVTGRWYSINWTNALSNGFTSLVNNIEFPQNSYTDTTHNGESESFYNIHVRMK